MENILLIVLSLIFAALLVGIIILYRGQTQTPESQTSTAEADLKILADRLNQFAEQQDQRLNQLNQNMTQNLRETTEKTTQNLTALGERLVLIDEAQKNISSLSGQVTGLQQILDNKQSRGAFGEVRLNDLVSDALPQEAYALQHTLSNGKRADCFIHLPNPPGSIVVDSKFPLESYKALQAAATPDEQKKASRSLMQDVTKHARDIAEKYIIAGETAEAALMFLPSESVFSELHLSQPEAIEKCRALRVYPVSPNTMWLTLNTVRAIMRDAEMHKQAHHIQKEVALLTADVGRLSTRVGNLRKHFGQIDKDITEIEISTNKIVNRGDKIALVELEQAELGQTDNPTPLGDTAPQQKNTD